MATLLHIDSSVFPDEASASRAVTAAFRAHWQEQHPEGTVVYRDLAAQPVPHLTAEAHTAGFADPASHTPEQAAAFAERGEPYEYVQNYLTAVLGNGLGLEVDSIVPELTMAPHNGDGRTGPAVRGSRDRALEAAATKAKHLAQRVAV